jgi:hypothetical protein
MALNFPLDTITIDHRKTSLPTTKVHEAGITLITLAVDKLEASLASDSDLPVTPPGPAEFPSS